MLLQDLLDSCLSFLFRHNDLLKISIRAETTIQRKFKGGYGNYEKDKKFK